MDLINTNRLRVSLRPFRRDYAESLREFRYGMYRSSDHGKRRPERNYYVHALGIVANIKWRPDGKLAGVGKSSAQEQS